MRINEVIVVEGKDDTVRVKLAVDADTIETNGSAINEETIEQIKHAKEKRGVIIFTDPDYPGERIRRIIDEHVPGCKHAFLPRGQAKGKKGLGIEHANVDDLKTALEAVYEVNETKHENIIWKPYLVHYGLIGGTKAKQRREKLGHLLKIGYANAKQLEKRLNMFQIEISTLEQAMKKIYEEERTSE
ncbi:ribonuclease M5 [Alkalibacillus haloalkaliphilus]|uniref:Ribonuclease M5 n=1 Tax=Alkalibacillus haloalkaliphilus TaxID=94136 RepID=A0A511W1S7_9BACI|nr:ribonuclease M5 [Alkalibacillus haloalkaliphilus]GEN44721.1 ribonuclease M5 [Alkalibacillus haloalkaliphilus]